MWKYTLIAIGVIIAIVLLAAAIMDKDYVVTSEVVINKPKNVVFDYVRMIKNQEKYSKWVMADPNIKMKYSGTDGAVGFKAEWTSEVKGVGVGEQEITKIMDGTGYEAEVRFLKPQRGKLTANVVANAVTDNQTKMVTTLNSSMPYPFNLMIPMIKNMLQKDLDTNGMNLKKILESQP